MRSCLEPFVRPSRGVEGGNAPSPALVSDSQTSRHHATARDANGVIAGLVHRLDPQRKDVLMEVGPGDEE
jgi:hypothetical protein